MPQWKHLTNKREEKKFQRKTLRSIIVNLAWLWLDTLPQNKREAILRAMLTNKIIKSTTKQIKEQMWLDSLHGGCSQLCWKLWEHWRSLVNPMSAGMLTPPPPQSMRNWIGQLGLSINKASWGLLQHRVYSPQTQQFIVQGFAMQTTEQKQCSTLRRYDFYTLTNDKT